MTTIPEGKWAIVTSSTENIATTRLAYCGITESHALVTTEKVQAGKLDPEGYLQAAKKLGVDIRCCLVVEDFHQNIIHVIISCAILVTHSIH
uniref:HAD-IA family hydrolase n=1 Tax=Xenorhabdus sp. TH1 TaxID=3130166 RepID=UPI0040400D66